MKDFDGKTVVITGGAGGIGRGMAAAFAAKGARLALVDRDPERLEQARAGLAAEGAQAMAIAFDIRDHARWKAAADEIEATSGPISVLCNNAGIGSSSIGVAPLHEIDAAQWRFLVEVNLFGAFYGVHTILPRMLGRGTPCHIVNTASLAGLYAQPGCSAYNASKYALIGMSDSLRLELEGTNVGISVLYPGVTATDFVTNSVKTVEEFLGRPTNASTEMANLLASGMNPDKVGSFVVRCIEDERYHIFSDVSYKQVAEEAFDDRLAGLAQGADPTFQSHLTRA